MDPVIAAGKLWVEAKYFHPALAYRDIYWDGAWVQAFPTLRAASNPIAEMVSHVHDSHAFVDGKQLEEALGAKTRIYICAGLRAVQW